MGIIQRIRENRIFQRLMRVLQFISSVISLGVFSRRIYSLIKLGQRARNADGAVEGILAAAVAYTITVNLIQFCTRHGAPKILRWVLILLDLLFVGAFIAVAVLTRPNNGPAHICYTAMQRAAPENRDSATCKLPTVTFAFAILSTLLHFITAVFHEVKDHHNKNKLDDHSDPEMEEGYNGGRSKGKHSAGRHTGNEMRR